MCPWMSTASTVPGTRVAPAWNGSTLGVIAVTSEACCSLDCIAAHSLAAMWIVAFGNASDPSASSSPFT